MTAPAVATRSRAGAQVERDRARRTAGRGLIEFYFRFHTILVYIFLYLPIIVVVVFAFNGTDRVVTKWGGLSLKWFGAALQDEVVKTRWPTASSSRSRTRSWPRSSARWRRSACSASAS